MNKAIYILAAIVLVVVLGWMNAYDYIPDGGHGIYRINRITHTVCYASKISDWTKIDESAGFDLSTAKPEASEFLDSTKPIDGNQPGFHLLNK